jgi:hypothetical protein
MLKGQGIRKHNLINLMLYGIESVEMTLMMGFELQNSVALMNV